MKLKNILAWQAAILFVLACGEQVNWTSTPEPVSDQQQVSEPATDSASTQAPPALTSNGPAIENCAIFPANNFFNAHVDTLPLHPDSDAWINSIGRDEPFHMDFGSGTWDGGPIGIPFNVLSGNT